MDEMGKLGFWQRLCIQCLKWAGWRLDYRPPPHSKALVIIYPHTSNWDFVLGMLAKGATGLVVHWVGKDSLFQKVFGLSGWFFRALGGVPVNRRQSTGFVGQMAEEFRSRSSFYLALAPEGTRSLTPGWRSGFYHLARTAEVPLALAFLDYAKREVGICDYLDLTGDEAQDWANIRAAYQGKQGRFPELQSPILSLKQPIR